MIKKILLSSDVLVAAVRSDSRVAVIRRIITARGQSPTSPRPPDGLVLDERTVDNEREGVQRRRVQLGIGVRRRRVEGDVLRVVVSFRKRPSADGFLSRDDLRVILRRRRRTLSSFDQTERAADDAGTPVRRNDVIVADHFR